MLMLLISINMSAVFGEFCRALHSFEAMCSLIMTLQLLATVDEGLSCVGKT